MLYVQNQPLQQQLPTMVTHTVFLISFHQSPSQRSNFAIFIPSTHDLKIGTLINVVDAPMIGFFPEFKRDYAPDIDEQPHIMTAIGKVGSELMIDTVNGRGSGDLFEDVMWRGGSSWSGPS